MKKIILYLLTLTYFSIFSAAAECNFTINIGEKINKKFIEKFTEPMEMYNGQFMLPVPSPEVCPNDNLGMDIANPRRGNSTEPITGSVKNCVLSSDPFGQVYTFSGIGCPSGYISH